MYFSCLGALIGLSIEEYFLYSSLWAMYFCFLLMLSLGIFFYDKKRGFVNRVA